MQCTRVPLIMFVCFRVSSVFCSHLHSCCFLFLVLCCSGGCLLCMLSFLHVCWLVGFYGTAELYRLYSAGECGECENECACRVDGVVPPCTLEQWVNSPPPSHWVCVPSSTGSNHSTLSGNGHILSSPSPTGGIQDTMT